jgi:activated CDC42 kinase 1
MRNLQFLIYYYYYYYYFFTIAFRIDDSFENQIASELAELDNIPEEEPMMWLTQPVPPPPPLAVPEEDDDDDEALLRNGDHVSCEDLLDFACDGPNSRRTRGPAHGSLSDEVRIMGKVLGKEVNFIFKCTR